jgi:hypothetical protein
VRTRSYGLTCLPQAGSSRLCPGKVGPWFYSGVQYLFIDLFVTSAKAIKELWSNSRDIEGDPSNIRETKEIGFLY